MVILFMIESQGAPEERSARREFELLLLLGGSRKGAVQLWLRKQRIYANALQAAGRPATEAKGSRGAAERQAGGESKPETAAQAAPAGLLGVPPGAPGYPATAYLANPAAAFAPPPCPARRTERCPPACRCPPFAVPGYG